MTIPERKNGRVRKNPPPLFLLAFFFFVSLRLSLKFVIQMKNQCDLLLFLTASQKVTWLVHGVE